MPSKNAINKPKIALKQRSKARRKAAAKSGGPDYKSSIAFGRVESRKSEKKRMQHEKKLLKSLQERGLKMEDIMDVLEPDEQSFLRTNMLSIDEEGKPISRRRQKVLHNQQKNIDASKILEKLDTMGLGGQGPSNEQDTDNMDVSREESHATAAKDDKASTEADTVWRSVSQMDKPIVDSQKQQDYLVCQLLDYSFAIGLLVRPPPSQAQNPKLALVTHAPITLYPSRFPRRQFQYALDIQKEYNSLYASVTCNKTFLQGLLEPLAKADDYTASLYNVHKHILGNGGYKHRHALGIFRSDYLLQTSTGHEEDLIKQVEFNTISVSFGGLSTRVGRLHKYLAQVGAYKDAIRPDDVVQCRVDEGIAHGLYIAEDLYRRTFNCRKSCVLIVVQPGERNIMDQRSVEYQLLEKFGVTAYRTSLADIVRKGKRGAHDALLFQAAEGLEPLEVSIVYYRAGYSPDDYPSDMEWDARTLAESCRAIKCPTILTQLAGAKKVQQVLAESGQLESLVSKDSAALIQKTFAELHTLDTSAEGMHARKLAFEQAERYVLKPQREGGGNNIYRSAIPGFLKSIPEDHWPGYILMELIEPPRLENSIIRGGDVVSGQVIDEIGIFGNVIWDVDTGQELLNEEVGHLCRTKGRESEEGGVAAGFGAVGSLRLY